MSVGSEEGVFEKFIGPAGSGGGWSDGLQIQNLILPVLLSDEGLTLYKRREWGERAT
jgi:hypothetical protein